MLSINKLEMDITFRCNLSCEGCTHYCDHHLKQYVPIETGKAWLKAWAQRLQPTEFTILGGEPMLHPDLCAYVAYVARLWPQACRKVITNGLALSRQPRLPQTLVETNTELFISVHSTEESFQSRLLAQFALLANSQYKDVGKVTIRPGIRFFKTYQGYGRNMRPFNHQNPRLSWLVCGNRGCYTLHKGQIWKCPPIAFLGMVADKFDLQHVPEWQPYLAYRGIGLDVADETLKQFFSIEEEEICRMCPCRLDFHRPLAGTEPAAE